MNKTIKLYIDNEHSSEMLLHKILPYKNKLLTAVCTSIGYKWGGEEAIRSDIYNSDFCDKEHDLISVLLLGSSQCGKYLLKSRLNFADMINMFNHYFDNLDEGNKKIAANSFFVSCFNKSGTCHTLVQSNNFQHSEHNKEIQMLFNKCLQATTYAQMGKNRDSLLALLAKKDNYQRYCDSFKKLILNNETIKKTISDKSDLGYDALDIALFSENKDFLLYCVKHDLIPTDKLSQLNKYQIKEKGFLEEVVSIGERKQLEGLINKSSPSSKKNINKL